MSERQNQLKTIVQDLHEGSDIRAVRKRFAGLIKNVSPQEIAEMEQSLIADGVPVEQVQKLCDIHAQVFEETLEKQKQAKTLPGHPVHTYIAENRAARQILKTFKRALKSVKGKETKVFEAALERLQEIEIHYQRKENQLFPYLEQVGFTGPSKVMWGKHDEIRSLLKTLKTVYGEGSPNRTVSLGRELIRAVRRMIFLEEKILFPTVLKKINDDQWAEIRRGEAAIGYAWIEPGNLWDPSVIAAQKAARRLGTASVGVPQGGSAGGGFAEGASAPENIPLDVGGLTGEQINLMLTNLPLDITYVDEEDKVRYYSQGRERLFPRSPAVIGRAVKNCHPPGSVKVVEKILESFRNKEKDTAEFWLTLNERFIHIRYFALYDKTGNYRGVVELSQDLTEIRSLSGERRLLDW